MFLLPKNHATQEQLFGRVEQQIVHKRIHCFKTRDPLPKAPDKRYMRQDLDRKRKRNKNTKFITM